MPLSPGYLMPNLKWKLLKAKAMILMEELHARLTELNTHIEQLMERL